MKHINSLIHKPKLPQVKSITALRRGLDTLGLVRKGNGLALGQLHTMTAIPKSSLLRILKTLEEAGWISRRMGDGLYIGQDHLSAEPGGCLKRMSLEEIAAGVLEELKMIMPCPSDLAIRSGTRMLVVQSNRPLFGHEWARTVIGVQPDMLGSAMGRAYLAFCPANERQDLFGQLVQPNTAMGRKREWLECLLKDICNQGYATRDPLYAGPDADHDAHLSAIAVPIHSDIGVVGCLSCVWRVGTVPKTLIISKGLALLVSAAKQISDRLSSPMLRLPKKGC